MQVADFNVKCRKATFTSLTRWCASLGLAGPALVAWPTDVAAQDAGGQDRVLAAVIQPAMSGNETSTAGPPEAVRPPADDSMKSAALVDPMNTNIPDTQIIVTPERAADGHEIAPQTFQSADLGAAVIHGRNIPGITKVTTSETPAQTHVTGVTLWDEIVPPTPPVPVGEAQTVPGSVASSGGK
jgi:hypothetical protein